MQSEFGNVRGKCANCGKEIAIRDIRNPNNYCSKSCASMKRYAKRYSGTMFGKATRDRIKEKSKEL